MANFRRFYGRELFGLLALLVVGCLASCQRGSEEAGGDYPPAKLPDPVVEERRAPQSRDNRIQVGDSLELFVDEDPGFDGIYKVREGGDIIIPRVGRIAVAGSSLSTAKNSITQALEEGQLQKATIIVDRVGRAPEASEEGSEGSTPQAPGAGRILVYITGKVTRPGQHVLTLPDGRPLGVYEALLIAGGMTRFADEQKVHVLRTGDDGKKHRIPVNVRQIENGETKDIIVGHGDIIVVPEKVFGTGF